MENSKLQELLDLTKPEHAYFYGLISCDGHVHKRSATNKADRGCWISITFDIKDAELLEKLAKVVPSINKREVKYYHRLRPDLKKKEQYMARKYAKAHEILNRNTYEYYRVTR
jgi:hypothetical protein